MILMRQGQATVASAWGEDISRRPGRDKLPVANLFADEIARRYSSTHFTVNGKSVLECSLNIGVVEYASHPDPRELIDRAQRALREKQNPSKRSGAVARSFSGIVETASRFSELGSSATSEPATQASTGCFWSRRREPSLSTASDHRRPSPEDRRRKSGHRM